MILKMFPKSFRSFVVIHGKMFPLSLLDDQAVECLRWPKSEPMSTERAL